MEKWLISSHAGMNLYFPYVVTHQYTHTKAEREDILSVFMTGWRHCMVKERERSPMYFLWETMMIFLLLYIAITAHMTHQVPIMPTRVAKVFLSKIDCRWSQSKVVYKRNKWSTKCFIGKTLSTQLHIHLDSHVGWCCITVIYGRFVDWALMIVHLLPNT